jgi:sulfite reductase (NADPH) flavoprotein alpha-component
MILIGNGTGLAGLRALLKSRIAGGHHDNWLIFGERNAAPDFYYRDELLAWQNAGSLKQLDLVFSRDGDRHEYVQDRLRARADVLKEWLSRGAAIYVCGSAQGMATGVDEVLQSALGKPVSRRCARRGVIVAMSIEASPVGAGLPATVLLKISVAGKPAPTGAAINA